MPDNWGIFDGEGAFWDADDLRLEQTLGTDLPRSDLCEYAVRNLGYIGIQLNGRVPRIKLRPAVVQPRALISLFYWLSDCRQECAAISWIDEVWTDEIVPGAANLRRRLCALCDHSDPAANVRLLSRMLPLSMLEAGTPLREIYDTWSVSRELTDVEVAASCFDQLFGGRYTITTPSPDASRMIILKIGSGYKTYHSRYLRHAIGTFLEDSPDIHYGRWVADAHRGVHFSGAPLFGDVDAIIDRPRQGPHRMRYRRLILPFARAAGERVLVTASSLAESIDLRVERA
jgi:hypothetical protein